MQCNVAQSSITIAEICQDGVQRWPDFAAKVLFVVNEAGMTVIDATQLADPVVDVTSPNSAEVSCVSALVTGLSRLHSVLGQDNVATLLVSHGDGSSELRTTLCGSDGYFRLFAAVSDMAFRGVASH